MTLARYVYHLKCLIECCIRPTMCVMGYKTPFVCRLSENYYIACFVLNIE